MSKLTEKQKRRLARHHAHREWLSQRFDIIRAGLKPRYVKVSIWDTEWWQQRRERNQAANKPKEVIAPKSTPKAAAKAAKPKSDEGKLLIPNNPAKDRRSLMQRRAGSK